MHRSGLAACTLILAVATPARGDDAAAPQMSVVVSIAGGGDAGVEAGGPQVACVFFDTDRAADGSIERCFPAAIEPGRAERGFGERNRKRLVVLEPVAPRPAHRSAGSPAGTAVRRVDAPKLARISGDLFRISGPSAILELPGTPDQRFPSFVVTRLSCVDDPCQVRKLRLDACEGTASVDDFDPPECLQPFCPQLRRSNHCRESKVETWGNGVETKVFEIPINDDRIPEQTESFTLRLVDPEQDPEETPLAEKVVEIVDNDILRIEDATAREGEVARFRVELIPAGPSTSSVTEITVQVEAGSATADDYERPAAAILIPAGETEAFFEVATVDDASVEAAETFTVRLTSVDGQAITSRFPGVDLVAVGTIEDNDVSPSISISDAPAVLEGDGGETNAVFEVTLSAQSEVDVSVDFRTEDQTATVADNDYEPEDGTLTIGAGLTSAQITVRVIGDEKPEEDETFRVELDNAVNATLADATGVGTIENDDPGTPGPEPPELPELAITDAAPVMEGAAGTTVDAVFEVTLSDASTLDVWVDFRTRDGPATAATGAAMAGDRDYLARQSPPRLRIPAGQTSTTLTVTVLGDARFESDETFSIELSNPTNATILDSTGLGTITNDDPRLSETELAMERLGDRRRKLEVGEREKLQVRVREDGNDKPGVTVRWEIVEGADLVRDNPKSTTDGSGLSSNRVRATGGGRVVVEARCDACKPGARLERFTLIVRERAEAPFIEFLPPASASVPENAGELVLQIGCNGTQRECSEILPKVTVGSTGVGTASEGERCASGHSADGSVDFVLPSSSRFENRRTIDYPVTICDDDVEEGAEQLVLLLGIGDREQDSLALAIVDVVSHVPHVTQPIDATRRLAEVNLGNVLSRLAALRQGGPALSSEFAALEIQGVRVPVDLLAHLRSDAENEENEEFDLARLLSGRETGSGASGDGQVENLAGDRERLGIFVSGILAFGERHPSEASFELLDSASPQVREVGRVHGFDFETDGLMVGVDYRFDSFAAGGAVSYSSTRSEVDQGTGRIDTDGLNLASYLMFIPGAGSSDNGNMYLDAVLSWGRNDFRHRRIEGGDERREANADFSGTQISAYVGSGYERNFGAAVVSGYGSLSFVRGDIEGYEETGDARALALTDPQELESLLVSVGVDVSYYLWFKGGVLAPGLRIALRRELEDESAPITGALHLRGPLLPPASQPLERPFLVRPAPPDRDYLNVGLSLLGSFEWGSVSLSYDRDLERSDFDLRALTAGVRIGF